VQGFSHLRVIPHCIRSMASGRAGLGKETAEVACTAISAKVAALVSSMWQGTLESTFSASWQCAFLGNSNAEIVMAEEEVAADSIPPTLNCHTACWDRALDRCLLIGGSDGVVAVGAVVISMFNLCI